VKLQMAQVKANLTSRLPLEQEWNHNGSIPQGIPMPNLSIKDVPEVIAEALRQRAASNHRSLQGELMAIIQQAVKHSSQTAYATQAAGERKGTRTIEEIAQARRTRYPEPIHGGPLAVDIIRADRDSR
jgi:plasmid stability protein